MQVEFRPAGGTALQLDYEIFTHLLRPGTDPPAIRSALGSVPPGLTDLLDALRSPDLTVTVDVSTAPTRRRHRFAYASSSGAALIAVNDSTLRLVPASRAFAASGLAQAVSLRPFPGDRTGPAEPADDQTITDLVAQDQARRSSALAQLRSDLAWRIRAAGDRQLDLTAAVRRDALLVSADGGPGLTPTSSTAVFRRLTRLTTLPGLPGLPDKPSEPQRLSGATGSPA
ncbi:hypothetical protein [Nocardioides panzhihuensis]|uniref:ESX secretion-associated protein EspG n=1 Tax=Nocardioides panzhihuensis TaxID=860243 RepID=A0A7Z0IUK6_9ACTN|nr:hypothetical protein [Nocardioides panzhihuensis]NYI80314.1 hypothetical protein [Nocardioides panzhihuensis]